jgi:hypothetical protein
MAWALHDEAAALASPPAATGIRLIAPGDPYLQKPNRSLGRTQTCASGCFGPWPAPERC